jgi:hypothetical protein
MRSLGRVERPWGQASTGYLKSSTAYWGGHFALVEGRHHPISSNFIRGSLRINLVTHGQTKKWRVTSEMGSGTSNANATYRGEACIKGG